MYIEIWGKISSYFITVNWSVQLFELKDITAGLRVLEFYTTNSARFFTP